MGALSSLTQVLYDLRDAMDTLALKSQRKRWCMPGLLATSYACIVAAHFGEFDGSDLLDFLMPVMESIFLQTSKVAGACTPMAGELLYRYSRFQLVQRGFRSQRDVFISSFKRLCRRDLHLHFCDTENGERSLFGCEAAFQTLQLFFPGRTPEEESLTFCSHAPLDEVSESASMQMAYHGPVSLALWVSLGRPPEATQIASTWLKKFRRRSSTRLTLVFLKSHNSSYGRRWPMYPAGILRKVAVTAAVSDFVLLSEPGFVPNTVLRGEVVRATLDLLESSDVILLLLPRHFMWRSDAFWLQAMHSQSASWQESVDPRIDFDLMYSGFLHNLWKKNHGMDTAAVTSRNLPTITYKDFEVVRNRNIDERLWTLKVNESSDLQLLLPATSILGSFWMDRLLRDVPWTVHALAVGARDFWKTLMQEMPWIAEHLAKRVGANVLLMILDAYDMVYVPSCPVDIPAEYYRHGKDLLISTGTSCWPEEVEPCPPCEGDCHTTKHHYLNSGGVLGPPKALSHAFLWMAEHTPDITTQDQGAWILYQKAFPERIALEYHPRIWVSLLGMGTKLEDFELRNDKACGTVYMKGFSDTFSPVCFLHGNGASKEDRLPRLVENMDVACGRPVSIPTKTVYQGLAMGNFVGVKVPRGELAFSAVPNLKPWAAKMSVNQIFDSGRQQALWFVLKRLVFFKICDIM
eukprot:Skav206078  [mRNA]  locus=scaffold1771:252961:255468:+ [translate_table: standard]